MMHTMKNKYIIRSRISEKKFREILKYFSTSLMLVALQEASILKPQKLQKLLKYQSKLYAKSLSKFAF